MDTSPEYVKMCAVADEIQKVWELSDGDFYYNQKRKDKSVIVVLNGWLNSRTSFDRFHQSDYSWLPRQDQLQEMIMSLYNGDDPIYKIATKNSQCDILLRRFKKFTLAEVSLLRLTTFEQLWLAFIMKEKYNKIWDGNKWVG
jgi:hypothetical protein